MITLTLNIGSLIGILGLATFICDIVALYVHRQSDVYRQQKFQDVDLNLLRLETLNTLPLSMMSEESKRKHANHIEEAILTGHVIDNTDATAAANFDEFEKQTHARPQANHHDCYDNLSMTSKETNHQSTPMLIYGNYHQQRVGVSNSLSENSPMVSIKQRRSPATTTNSTRPSQLTFSNDEKIDEYFDRANIVYVDEDSPDVNERRAATTSNYATVLTNAHATTRLTPKIETFL